ncbi:hypothetical protein C2845_PM10G09700 [Panicum miliaceum]|uniref:hAT-like transposase RNase-H fold domain-containing protein n=1 Tax=Panicum miliaceum TaxID=4540 RepID=A0A3L6PDK3_PANMI|nr:hypothetical protein C2845_PM10G09700 [Panicum miliaceum]
MACYSASGHPHIEKMSRLMKEKFNKYWTDVHGFIAVAVVLDPRFKLHMLKASFASEADGVRNFLYQLVLDYQKAAEDVATLAGGTSTSEAVEGSGEDDELFSILIVICLHNLLPHGVPSGIKDPQESGTEKEFAPPINSGSGQGLNSIAILKCSPCLALRIHRSGHPPMRPPFACPALRSTTGSSLVRSFIHSIMGQGLGVSASAHNDTGQIKDICICRVCTRHPPRREKHVHARDPRIAHTQGMMCALKKRSWEQWVGDRYGGGRVAMGAGEVGRRWARADPGALVHDCGAGAIDWTAVADRFDRWTRPRPPGALVKRKEGLGGRTDG